MMLLRLKIVLNPYRSQQHRRGPYLGLKRELKCRCSDNWDRERDAYAMRIQVLSNGSLVEKFNAIQEQFEDTLMISSRANEDTKSNG